MSQITLKPLDDGQKAVEIPLGKTTIGRGALLGCSDKKVSRNHAVLEVTAKNEVFLTPTHVNPCFYQPTADSPGTILKKDSPHKLENGDTFSLLPRAYRYQLIVQGDKSPAERNEGNKPSEKTNGSTGDDHEDQINEEKSDSPKEVGSEKRVDKTIAENASSNESENAPSADKSSLKERDSVSHKVPEVSEDNSKSTKEKQEDTGSSTPTKLNNITSETKDSAETKGNSNADDSKKKSDGSKNDLPKPSESKEDGISKSEDKSKPSDSKEAKEPIKEKSPKKEDSADKDTSSERKGEKAKEDLKAADDSRQSLEDETLDTVASKDSTNDAEAEKTRLLSDWKADESPAPAKEKKKRGPAKGTKRKAPAADTPNKVKGRKKAKKYDFGEEVTPRQTPGRTSGRTNRQSCQGFSLEDFVVSNDEEFDEWDSDGDRPKRRRKRKGGRKKADSGSDWEVERKKPKKAAAKGGSGSESGSDFAYGASPKKGKKGPKPKRRKGKHSVSEGGSDGEPDKPSSNAVSEKKTRIPCTYGKKCFRKNQNHLSQFSHPGDPEYKSEAEGTTAMKAAVSESEEEAAASAPKKECPYGANCFRKNPQHRKDFKHTKKVRPTRDAKQGDKKGKGSSDEIDSYDLDESLRDDSADEYKPADSGSDYETKKPKRPKAKAGGKTKRGRRA